MKADLTTAQWLENGMTSVQELGRQLDAFVLNERLGSGLL
jgi:hypothetical protein